MIKFCTLVSGSSGNATFLRHNNVRLLIDCGISGKSVTEALSSIDEDVAEIDYILVTHEHSDHVNGVGVISRRYNIPIIASAGTWQSMNIGKIQAHNMLAFNQNKPMDLGDIEVVPFSLPHDGAQPTGYRFNLGACSVAIATDIGHVTDEIIESVRDCVSIVIESNHDVDMLVHGPYPFHLKQRVRGKNGHLSNKECGDLAAVLVKHKLQNILLGHLSEQNNLPTLAHETVAAILRQNDIHIGADVRLNVANRYKPSMVI